MTPKLLSLGIFRPSILGLERSGLRFFSGRRVRKATRSQLTSQENLLLQQRLREMELQMQMQQQMPRKQGVMSIIKEGLLHGIGWSFAQRMVDSIFGPRTINISDFTGNHSDSLSGSSGLSNDPSSTSPFSDNGSQDEGWSWGSDLFSDDE